MLRRFGPASIPVSGAAARKAAVVTGAALNTGSVIASNGVEAHKNPEINKMQETVVESGLKTGGDIVGAALGIPGLGAVAVGAKDVGENVIDTIRENKPSQEEDIRLSE